MALAIGVTNRYGDRLFVDGERWLFEVYMNCDIDPDAGKVETARKHVPPSYVAASVVWLWNTKYRDDDDDDAKLSFDMRMLDGMETNIRAVALRSLTVDQLILWHHTISKHNQAVMEFVRDWQKLWTEKLFMDRQRKLLRSRRRAKKLYPDFIVAAEMVWHDPSQTTEQIERCAELTLTAAKDSSLSATLSSSSPESKSEPVTVESVAQRVSGHTQPPPPSDASTIYDLPPLVYLDNLD